MKQPPIAIDAVIDHCPLGAVAIAVSAQGLCGLLLGHCAEAAVHALQQRFPQAQLGKPRFASSIPITQAALTKLHNPQQPFNHAIHFIGTPFQQTVWMALTNIAMGQTLSYQTLAQRIGQPKASRAVASACAANTIAIIVPCHRVIRQNGDLGGYRWGLDTKKRLLLQEASLIQQHKEHRVVLPSKPPIIKP
jgi:AraC family transcriptional regulator of adaptative response/methylated-DNA-[protein]-cysteine methyltransferase